MQKLEAWKIICQVINTLINDLKLKNLPFERIFINFGNWQSNNSGHAHVNIVLTREAIDSSQK